MNFHRERYNFFFVPSMACQSLLGKAVQEHFTHPRQVASVFSSSPSLQNSSAGANILSNFKLDDEASIKLFKIIFTPEDCFSVQFTPTIMIEVGTFCSDEGSWIKIFSFMTNLVTKTKYIEASLRSLTISTQHIDDEQLHFLLSNLKRLTKLDLNFHYDSSITSLGFSSIEKLTQLEHLGISAPRGVVDTSVLQLVASRCTKINTLILMKNFQENAADDSMFEIAKMVATLTSLELHECDQISAVGINHLTSLKNLLELKIVRAENQQSKFREDVLQSCSASKAVSDSLPDVDRGDEALEFLAGLGVSGFIHDWIRSRRNRGSQHFDKIEIFWSDAHSDD
jgi:hypothetical protein